MSLIINKFILAGRMHAVPASLHFGCHTPWDYSGINSNLPSLNALAGISQEAETSISPEYSVFLKLLFLYALRFAELYAAKIADILPPDRIMLPGAKKSAGALIFVPCLSQTIEISSKNIAYAIFPGITYKKCWLLLRKLNIPSISMAGKNFAATHFGRKCIDIITKGRLSDIDLSDALRHRSKTSSVYYRSNQTRNEMAK